MCRRQPNADGNLPGSAMLITSSQRNRILLLSSLLIPLFLYCVTIWKDYTSIAGKYRNDAIRTAHIFEQHTLNVFETHQLIAEKISGQLQDMDWKAIEHSMDLHSYLESIKHQYPQIDALWLADRTGRVRAASQLLPENPINISERHFFRELRRNGNKMSIGRLLQSLAPTEQNFNIGYRREDASGVFDGAIVITLSPHYFISFWGSVLDRPGSAAYLLRPDGSILAGSSPVTPQNSQLARETDPMQALTSNTQQGTFIGSFPQDCTQRIYAFRKLDRFDLYILSGYETKTLLREWLQHAGLYGAFFGIAAIALFGLARKIVQLYEQMEQRVERRTVQLVQSNRELGQEIEARKQAEEYRDELEEQLVEAKRLEAIGQIAGGVAHEVRNPLNAILFVTEALFKEKSISSNPDLDPYMQHIRTQVRRLSSLMTELLELGKPIPRSLFQPVLITAVCSEALDALRLSETSNSHVLTIVSDAGLETCHVYADPQKLRQSLVNLLENAVQNSPEESEVLLRLTTDSRFPDYAVLQIIDVGQGIAAEYLPRIFEPFYTSRIGGTGLGLALVKHYIESMDGRVRIWNNTPPPGCTAEIRLPLAHEAQA